jgi:hypothetical protein
MGVCGVAGIVFGTAARRYDEGRRVVFDIVAVVILLYLVIIVAVSICLGPQKDRTR